MNGLSHYEHDLEAFMRWIGDHADAGTEHIVRSRLARAPEVVVARVRESMRAVNPRNRAAWIVGALDTAIREREAA